VRAAEALTGGFPASREALYAYDAVVLANLDVRLLPRERLGWLRDFVSVRGGGLLMLGARSFDAQALAGTPIEELLPLRPAESNGIMPVVATSGAQAGRVRVTLDGLRHPMMRIAATDEEASRRWAQLPALAGTCGSARRVQAPACWPSPMAPAGRSSPSSRRSASARADPCLHGRSELALEDDAARPATARTIASGVRPRGG
jgi:hypothetical protein